MTNLSFLWLLPKKMQPHPAGACPRKTCAYPSKSDPLVPRKVSTLAPRSPSDLYVRCRNRRKTGCQHSHQEKKVGSGRYYYRLLYVLVEGLSGSSKEAASSALFLCYCHGVYILFSLLLLAFDVVGSRFIFCECMQPAVRCRVWRTTEREEMLDVLRLSCAMMDRKNTAWRNSVKVCVYGYDAHKSCSSICLPFGHRSFNGHW